MSRGFLTWGAFLSAFVAISISFVPRASKSVPSPATPPVQKSPPSPEQGPAALVLTNALIETMDPAHEWAAAVAIRGENIVAVSYITPGSPEVPQESGPDAPEIKPWIGPQTQVIDLHHEFAMPGFNDAHVHIASAGLRKLSVDFTGVRSLPEFQQRIRENLKNYKPGEWITGSGWDQTLWPDKHDPTLQDLDAISAENPMFFGRVDGHVAVANSPALKMAGITKDTPDPPGSRIRRDPQTKEPTGFLEEDGAKNLVLSKIPPPTREQRLRGIELVLEGAARVGVTSMQDNSILTISTDAAYSQDNFLIYQQLRKEGRLTARITEWLDFTLPVATLESLRSEWGSTDPWLKTGALKGFLDGSLGSRTAAMLAPYSDAPNTSGILRVGLEQLKPMAIERDRARFQLAFHAIGDRANRVALDTFAAVVAANGPRDRRDRIEHAQVVAPEDFARFGQLDVVASMQPSHLLDDERWASDRLGPERSQGAYAWRAIETNGAHLAFGTDHPVEPLNPLRGIYACITRKPTDADSGGQAWEPRERLPINDCLRAYTVGSAYAEFEEKRKGIIAPGMFADVVVYPADINQITAKNILTMQVELTIAGGRIVYQNPRTHLAQ
ncbi:MAG: amidohydrolase family protein [Candidatus Acidiferrales bacterium]